VLDGAGHGAPGRRQHPVLRLAGWEPDDVDLPDAQAITQDNLDVVLDAGWITQDDLCQGVDPGTVDACG
jgi:hypothetical protein